MLACSQRQPSSGWASWLPRWVARWQGPRLRTRCRQHLWEEARATTLINIEWRIFTAAAYASSHRQGTRHGGSFPRTCAGPSATTPISIKTPRQIRDFRPADPCGGRRRDRRVHSDRNPEIFRVILAPTMLRTVLAGAIVATAAAFAPAGPVRLRCAAGPGTTHGACASCPQRREPDTHLPMTFASTLIRGASVRGMAGPGMRSSSSRRWQQLWDRAAGEDAV